MSPKRLSLTFDNGPTHGVTERVLEILDRHGARASFFVIGNRLLNSSAVALLRQVSAAGHAIGNHTLTHSVAFGDRPDAAYARREIEDAQALIGVWPGQEKLFRPYGNDGLLGRHLFSAAALSHLRAHGYTSVIWNVVPGDWRNPSGWAKECIATLNNVDWPVVVLHDIAGACLKGLPDFLTRIKDLGVRIEREFPNQVVVTRNGCFVTLSNDIVAGGVPHG